MSPQDRARAVHQGQRTEHVVTLIMLGGLALFFVVAVYGMARAAL